MKLFLTFVSTFAIVVAESIPGQGGYSSGGGGGAFNFGSGGYTTGGGGGGSSSAGFSAPAAGASSGYAGGSASGQGTEGAAQQGPQVFRYVSVHSAPADPDDEAVKTVRVPGGNNKHVNIIFVKAPSNGADQKTEIVLPEQDEQKNLVYVLVKKTDATANLKIKKPQPTKPSQPEVYFIRYKGAGQQQAGQGGQAGFGGDTGPAGPSAGYGSPSAAYGSPSTAYGAP